MTDITRKEFDALKKFTEAIYMRLTKLEILYGGYFKTPEGYGEGIAKLLNPEVLVDPVPSAFKVDKE